MTNFYQNNKNDVILFPNPNDMNIGNTIRKFRIKKNKTQQEIADLLNVDRRTYAKWEEGITDVRSSLIPKIAEIFNVKISDLYNEREDVNKDADTKNAGHIIIVITTNNSVEKLLNLLQDKD